MTIILTYLKCKDDWKDGYRPQARSMLPFSKRPMKHIEGAYPHKIQAVREALQKIAEPEKAQSRDLDRLSSLSGAMMAEIVIYRHDEWYDTLYRLGDYLGGFIRIMDAYDDVEDDRKKGQFNPFLGKNGRTDFGERIKVILELTIFGSTDAFEALPILWHADILRNILYTRAWTEYGMIRKKRTGERDR